MKIIRIITVICFAFFISNCSTEQAKNPVEGINSAEENLNNRGSDLDEGISTLVIVWKKGTRESAKEDIRAYYKKKNYLLEWEKCNNEADAEVWTVNYKTHIDPMDPPEDQPDALKVIYHVICIDL